MKRLLFTALMLLSQAGISAPTEKTALGSAQLVLFHSKVAHIIEVREKETKALSLAFDKILSDCQGENFEMTRAPIFQMSVYPAKVQAVVRYVCN